MRKWMAFVLAFACVLGLAGCGSAEPHEMDLSENLSSISSPPVIPDVRTLNGPPELVVSTINHVDSVTASCGNYQWSREMPNGMGSSVIACGAHPLDEIGERAVLYTAFSAGTLPPLAEGQYPGCFLSVFYLDFGEIPPETVTARRWPSSYIGHVEEAADSEEVTVDFSDGFIILPLGDGEFVYEVHAVWGGAGDAHYVFDTVPQIREDT